MRVCVWSRPTENRARQALDAMASGIQASGGEVEHLDPLMPNVIRSKNINRFDAHVIFSIQYQRSETILAACKHHRKPCIVIDSAWMRRGEYYSVGLNGINGAAEFRNEDSPSDRLETLGIEIKPWRDEDSVDEGANNILVCGQSKNDSGLSCDRLIWAQRTIRDVVEACRNNLVYPWIVYRPHPGDRRNPGVDGSILSIGNDLSFDLARARILVTHTSNVVVDALLEGIPVYTTGISVAGKECFRSELKEIDLFKTPTVDRQQFFNNLAYAQWTASEIAEGIPFRRLMGIEQEVKQESDHQNPLNGNVPIFGF